MGLYCTRQVIIGGCSHGGALLMPNAGRCTPEVIIFLLTRGWDPVRDGAMGGGLEDLASKKAGRTASSGI